MWRICFWVFVVLIALTWVHLRGRSAFCLTAPAGLLQNAPGKSHSVGPAPCLLNFGPFINCFDSVHAINGVDAAVMRKDSPEQQKEYERSRAYCCYEEVKHRHLNPCRLNQEQNRSHVVGNVASLA